MYDFENLIVQRHPPDAMDTLQGMEETELTNNIVSLAALERANDDCLKGLKKHREIYPEGVGTLYENNEEKPLTAREACNKVIHSTSKEWNLEYTTRHPIYYQIFENRGEFRHGNFKNPILVVYGAKKNGKVWKASIEMVKWVHAVAFFI